MLQLRWERSLRKKGYIYIYGWVTLLFPWNHHNIVNQLCVLVHYISLPNSAIPCNVAHQAPLSVGFSRQEHWHGLPFPTPGDLPHPWVKPRPPALQVDSLLFETPEKPINQLYSNINKRWCLTLAITRERQIKTTVRYLLTPIRISTIKKQIIADIGEDVETLECLCAIGGNVQGYRLLEKLYDCPWKIKNRITIFLAIPLLAIFPK